MRRPALFFILLFLTCAAHAVPSFPALTGRVVDNANIIDAVTKQAIERELAAYEQASGNQIVVVTLSTLQGIPIEDYGYQLGRYWGIGQKGKNSGALLIVAPKDRQTRIEVGYGLEGDLTDAMSKMIIEHRMIPYFKNGDFSAGIHEGVNAMIKVLGGDVTTLQTMPQAHQSSLPLGAILPILLIFLFLRGFNRRRSGLLGPFILGSMLGSSRSSGWGGSGFTSGFRGGGGSFGGGGASGRW